MLSCQHPSIGRFPSHESSVDFPAVLIAQLPAQMRITKVVEDLGLIPGEEPREGMAVPIWHLPKFNE